MRTRSIAINVREARELQAAGIGYVTDDIRAMIESSDMGIIGARDRAIILLGFAGAFRRS